MFLMTRSRYHLLSLGALAIAVATLGCSSSPTRHDVSAALDVPPVAMASMSASEPTLYERLGGYDAISAVVDVFAM